MANVKNITELPVAESSEGLNLIVNDGGSAKQIAASAVGAQADFSVTDETSPAFIKNKPEVVQADWNVSDETSPAFIKNKPFYDTREYGDITLTFDGDMTGKETVPINEEEGFYFVKISDKTAPKEEFIGASIILTSSDASETIEITGADMLYNLADGAFLVGGEYAVVVLNELALEGYAPMSCGIWVMCQIENGAATMYTSELSWYGVTGGELKQIDPKYVAGLKELMSSVVTVHSGTAEPTSDIGEDGDVYLVTEG